MKRKLFIWIGAVGCAGMALLLGSILFAFYYFVCPNHWTAVAATQSAEECAFLQAQANLRRRKEPGVKQLVSRQFKTKKVLRHGWEWWTVVGQSILVFDDGTKLSSEVDWEWEWSGPPGRYHVVGGKIDGVWSPASRQVFPRKWVDGEL